VQEPFNVNRVALAAGRAAVALPGFVETRRAEVAAARELLRELLTERGLSTHPSQANFLLVNLGMDDGPVCERLLHEGVLIRGGTEFGLPGFARITVAREPVMRRTAELVGEAVAAAH
jgi:histidinol-phosphate aminotransferase